MNERIVSTGMIVTAMLVVTACGVAASPAPPAGATPAVIATPSEAAEIASPSEAASATASAGVVTNPDDGGIEHAMAQRRVFGLRSDEAWVRQVAADPRARTELLDFPMLPEEEAEFEALQTGYEAAAAAVNAYAEDHRNEFGGVWIDQPRHTVVAAWTASPDLHRLAILARLGTTGPLEVKLVRYTEQQLNDLTDRLFLDRDWYETIRAMPLGGGAMVTDNRVELSISSANPAAPGLVLAHFGVPPDMLRVISDGTGIALQPRGTVLAKVVTASGGEPGRNQLDVAWTSDRSGPGTGDCGDMVGYLVPPDGRFELPCAPGGWTIKVNVPDGDGWKTVGSGHVVVPPGKNVDLTITIDAGVVIDP